MIRYVSSDSLCRCRPLSPNGEHFAFTYEEGTEVKLGVMERESKKIISSFGFGENMHVLGYWWGSDSRVVMSVGEVTGNLDDFFHSRLPVLRCRLMSFQ